MDFLLAAVTVAYEFKFEKEKRVGGDWGVGMHAGALTWNAFYYPTLWWWWW